MNKKIITLILVSITLILLSSCKSSYNIKEYKTINMNKIQTWINTEKEYLPSLSEIEKVTIGMNFKKLVLLIGKPENVYSGYDNSYALFYNTNENVKVIIWLSNNNEYKVIYKIVEKNTNNIDNQTKEIYLLNELVELDDDDLTTWINNDKSILPKISDIEEIKKDMLFIDAIKKLGRPDKQEGSDNNQFVFILEDNIKCIISVEKYYNQISKMSIKDILLCPLER